MDRYLQEGLTQISRRKGVTTRAGEMVCVYLDLENDQFMYFRQSAPTTILDTLDPVQLMIPTPMIAKLLPGLDKSKTVVILNEVLNAAAA